MEKNGLLFKLPKLPEIKDLRSKFVILINAVFFLFQIFYAAARQQYLNPYIPVWYTKPWGDLQLAPTAYIYIIPVVTLIFITVTLVILSKFSVLRSKEASFITLTFLTLATVFLTISEVRIVNIASSPFKPLFDPRLSSLLPYLFISLAVCVLLVPLCIKLAYKYDIVTDPERDKHPGMILKKPSARGGAVAFFLSFLVIALIFVPLTRVTVGLYIGAFITTLIGLADDIKSINPYVRLLVLLPIAVIITLAVSDLHIFYFASPFDGIMRLDFIKITYEIFDMKFNFFPVADIFTVIWILWVMNMLSWSNAVDGQFSGMTAITCIITAVIAVGLLKIDHEQIYVARLAVIAAGASLGLLPYNWHPSKIMWGFGATAMGLTISVLSIMAGTKVAVATLVLIVPTLDALVTIVRRILQKKSPVWGDRGHLHHRLLDMGFSQQGVAILYWVITALIGVIALLASGRAKFLALLTIGGIVSFILVAMNLKGEPDKLKLQEPAK